ncbi:siderophore-iron reductase FhuF [Achromobacter sp. UMC46]|uniref:siderophore-iron reductase FhuF n=1 Tax=Achromobacter sp. UMC46 TaxID=1862319 RepID=UPI0015FF3077|nr:siderophore-iron reductase FhuF [Achromobacter sp. UMC46]MBB1593237.1 siderophore-iron reductase FhuF [Achromobacter sp. UMC46]
MIALLQPFFREEWRPYAETVQWSAPAADARNAAALLGDEAGLADALARHRRHWSDADPRAVASAWAMSYLWTLLPPMAAAASGARHALPARSDAMWIELDANAAPARFQIQALGAADPAGDVWRRYHALVWHHLQPLAEALFRAGRLPRKVVWGGAVRYLEVVLKAVETHTHGTAASDAVRQDRLQLLENPWWGDAADERPNPLCLPPRTSRGADPMVTLHRECCLYHLLPTAQYCAACPLAPQHRASRAKTR